MNAVSVIKPFYARLLVLREALGNFITGKKAAAGFAEQAVLLMVVASIVAVVVWVGTIVYGMMENAGGML